MSEVILKNKTSSGDTVTALFLPEKGMNLISYKLNDIEVIDQSTRSLFEERFAGLGAMIGPHFYRRKPEIIPHLPDESLFPHIARVKATGPQDPFSHGIGRYAPWKAEATETEIKATLSGKDIWNGVALSAIEGQNFKMGFHAALTPNGLVLDLSVVSDIASLVGIHYYLHLPNGKGTVSSRVQNKYIVDSALQNIPKNVPFDAQNYLRLPLDRSVDWTFYPFPNPLEGHILLDTDTHQIDMKYWCNAQENAWQLYHPQGASYVCMEPVSAQDPRHPNLTVSSIRIQIEILKEGSRHAI